ncbi:MAG: DNA polymerase III subunit delta' [Candidatus Nanopelagicales bacterium]
MTPGATGAGSVDVPVASELWDAVIGQPGLVATLGHAAADAARIRRGEPGPAMTHAWLLTGPPGSGRSTAARVFAAALQCPEGGCGTCASCRDVLAGAHADVDQFTPEKLQITAEESLELIRRAAMTPIMGRWNVLIVEDADRLNDVSGNALLKSLEEPSPRTVWILCSPTAEDVLPTIVSRTRAVRLVTPSTAEVADALVRREGIDRAVASFAARAAQGHIGRARALARDEAVRIRRSEVLAIPGTLRDLAACFIAAQNLIEAATADAAAITDALDGAELDRLNRAYGEGATGAMAARVRRTASAATKELEARQKSRRTRTIRDQIDRALLDLTGLYRDVLVCQSGAEVPLINDELRPTLERMAVHGDVAATMARLAALDQARLAVGASVAPLLALEALMVQLARGR